MTTQDRQIIKFLNKAKKKFLRLDVGYYNDDFVLFSDSYVAWTRRKDMLDERLNDYIKPMNQDTIGRNIYDILNGYFETPHESKDVILIEPKALKEYIRSEKAKGNNNPRLTYGDTQGYTFSAEYVSLIESQLYTQAAQLVCSEGIIHYPILLFENDLGERALILPTHLIN